MQAAASIVGAESECSQEGDRVRCSLVYAANRVQNDFQRTRIEYETGVAAEAVRSIQPRTDVVIESRIAGSDMPIFLYLYTWRDRRLSPSLFGELR